LDSQKTEIMIDTPMPETIGGYGVRRQLGRGGMGVVYLAADPSGDLVAVKVIAKCEIDVEDEAVARLEREAEILNRLDHPNLVKFHKSGADENYFYLVMEYIDGGTLSDLLKAHGGTLPPEHALRIVAAVSSALSAAGQEQIVHRDIKPGNVLFTAAGEVKVADFGIARRLDDMIDTRMTLSGLGLGTPSYMAPEQARDSKRVDGRSDIYALGIVLYEMLTGGLPFTGKSAFDVIRKHMGERLPPPQTHRPDLPAPCCAVVCKMLEKSPDHRYQTHDALLLDLSRLASGDTDALEASAMLDSLLDDPPGDELSTGRSRAGRFVVIGLLLIILLAMIALVSRGPRHPDTVASGDNSTAPGIPIIERNDDLVVVPVEEPPEPVEAAEPEADGEVAYEDAEIWQDSKYKAVWRDDISWADARAECKRAGGKLVSISSVAEQRFLHELTESNVFWIGCSKEDGTWTWEDGRVGYAGLKNYGAATTKYGYMTLNVRGALLSRPESGRGYGNPVRGFICEWPVEARTKEGY
jgi:serine/threonine protein kinase